MSKAFDVTLKGVQLRGNMVSGHIGWASDWLEDFQALVAAGLVEWRTVSPDQQEPYLTTKATVTLAQQA